MSTTGHSATDSDGPPAWKRELYHAAQDTADDVLGALRADRRFCANCFRQFREFDAPPEGTDYPECVSGFSYSTENGESGPTTTFRLVPTADDGGAEVVVDGFTEGLVCECGVGHHAMRRRPVRKHVGRGHARRLSDAIHTLAEEHETERERCTRRAYHARKAAVEAGMRAGDDHTDTEAEVARCHEQARKARQQRRAEREHFETARAWEHDRDRLVDAYDTAKSKHGTTDNGGLFRRALTKVYVEQGL
jgi:hypothetical protein